MKPSIWSTARHGTVDSLRLRLLATISGVTMSAACTAGAAGETPTASGCTPAGVFAPGVEACEGGFVHRTSASTCELSTRVGTGGGVAEPPGAAGSGSGVALPVPQCDDDYDCTDLPNGYCVYDTSHGWPECQYACSRDVDCGEGFVCSCSPGIYQAIFDGSPVSTAECVPASCVTDLDCEGENLCVAATSTICGPQTPYGFHCQSLTDECSGPGDCSPSRTGSVDCSPDNDGNFRCSSGVCGRPFFVENAVRQSALVATSAWRDAALASSAAFALDQASRAAIADHFARAGLMEHASIAAFARFTLQLLALGAPPELVADATSAMADETRHARLCFELASRYAGRDLGPGPLDVAGALGAIELLDVVDLVIDEGCIGETTAALEARWAAEAAAEPLVRDVLLSIADDEARHAELAYRFVVWASARDARVGARLRQRLHEALAAEESRPADAALDAANASALALHGVVTARTHREARSAVLGEILPSLVAALDGRAPVDADSRVTVSL